MARSLLVLLLQHLACLNIWLIRVRELVSTHENIRNSKRSNEDEEHSQVLSLRLKGGQ